MFAPVMPNTLNFPCVVRSSRTAGSTFGRVFRFCRRGGIIVCLLAMAGAAAAQSTGVTATFTGTLPSSAGDTSPQPRPLAVQATSTQTAIVFGALPVATSTPGQLTATFTVSGYSGSFTPTATTHYGI